MNEQSFYIYIQYTYTHSTWIEIYTYRLLIIYLIFSIWRDIEKILYTQKKKKKRNTQLLTIWMKISATLKKETTKLYCRSCWTTVVEMNIYHEKVNRCLWREKYEIIFYRIEFYFFNQLFKVIFSFNFSIKWYWNLLLVLFSWVFSVAIDCCCWRLVSGFSFEKMIDVKTGEFVMGGVGQGLKFGKTPKYPKWMFVGQIWSHSE